MNAEAPHVRRERIERGGPADVRDPRAWRDRGRDLGDRTVGHAEEHEIGMVAAEREPALAEARRDGRADPAAADHVDASDHECCLLQFLRIPGFAAV